MVELLDSPRRSHPGGLLIKSFFTMTTGPDHPPDEVDPAKSAADAECPQCGGPRYRGPFGVTCPRCLLATIVDGPAAHARRVTPSIAPGESKADEARRFDHFEIMLRADGSWWELGRGSLGATYRALDVDSLLPVALKVIDGAGASEPVAPTAIFQQALTIAKLQHPHVARLIHFGTGADGRCFLATELIEGETLPQLVQRAGPLPVSIVLEAGAQIVRALVAAGERHIRHGDLKPANIMLADERDKSRPVVKVLDFGVADWFGGRELGPSHREFAGTPGFASPEQSEGREIDVRSDFYSLGATFYFLLSGRAPDATGSSRIAENPKLASRVHFTPLRERGVPEEVVAWLRRLLDPNPAGRPKDAFELVESLAALRAHLKKPTLEARPPSRVQTTRWWSQWFGPQSG
jgi:serine/threonine protein kinase